jgi:hypothetical protein
MLIIIARYKYIAHSEKEMLLISVFVLRQLLPFLHIGCAAACASVINGPFFS